MRSLLIASSLVLVAIAGMPRVAGQNNPFVVLDLQQSVLHRVARSNGLIIATSRLPGGMFYRAMTEGSGDHVLLVGHQYSPSTVNSLFRVDGQGSVSTAAVFRRSGQVQDLTLDDAGDPLLLWYSPAGGSGFYVAPAGASTLSLLAPWPAGAAVPMAFAAHQASGDWFAIDRAGYVHRVPRQGAAITSLARSAATNLIHAGMTSDRFTRDILLAAGGTVSRLDTQTLRLTTIYHPTTLFGPTVADVHFDEPTRAYLVTGWRGFGHGNAGFYGLIDGSGKQLYLGAVNTLSLFTKIRATFGRAFIPLTPPLHGRTYRVVLTVTGESGAAYQAAFAFAHTPGLATPAGTIPLAFDAMTALSLGGAPIFRGLAGRLDTAGRATIEVDLLPLPPIRGLRLHLAAVTLAAGGIRSIRGPHSFTIR